MKNRFFARVLRVPASLSLLLPWLLAVPVPEAAGGGRPALAALPDRPIGLPDTPVGRQLAGWLDALNSGDIERMRRFVADHWARSAPGGMRPVEFLTHVYSDTRGLDPYALAYASDYRLVVLARSRLTGEWHKVIARTEVQPPHGLVVNGVFLDPGPADSRARGKLSEADVLRGLETYLEKLSAADEFSGVVLVARGDTPLFQRAYGLADRGRGAPNRLDTRFSLASMGKLFTAVAVCQLAERGRLKFTDPFGTYLPDYPNRSVAERVTLHHLLTHTSGLGDFFGKKEYESAMGRYRHPEDYFPLFANDPLAFEPGTDDQYSNAGFMVLGAVVEKVSGQRFPDYVREHVFRPAGMTDAGYGASDQDVPNLAVAYRNAGWDPGFTARRTGSPTIRTPVTGVGGQGSPVGGGYATVGDFLKFARALRTHKLLGPRATQMVLAGEGELGMFGALALKYVYGFRYTGDGGQRILGHSGGYPGVSGQFDFHVDRDYAVVALSNADPPAGNLPAAKFRQLVTQGTGQIRQTLTGDVRAHPRFRSNVLGNDRAVFVYLPPGYDADPGRCYPVLYLHDGQNLFDEAAAGGPEWRVDETAQALIAARVIEPLIIVGIANAGEYRMDEYTPTLDPRLSAGGKADLYGRMLVEELKPFIDRTYRTLPDRTNTGLGGSSLGGLVSVHLGLKYPDTFGKLALLSTSVGWDDRAILRRVDGLPAKPPLRIWLDVGAAEGATVKAAQGVTDEVRRLRDALVAKGWVLNADLKYLEAPGAGHDHRAWSLRVDPFLRYLFPPK
jgi:CubicO group peptidase (beta-lactamase class C family)/predicted alpha/beta superfamily hydrolase